MTSFPWRCAVLLAGLGVLDAGESQPLHYWNGNQRVEVVTALDEVVVEDATGRRSVALGSAALADTVAEAKRLAAAPGVTAVRAALYRPGAGRTLADRQVLTGRLSLRVNPGQDVQVLAQRHGLVVVEAVSYSPDTYICAVNDGGLLSALEIANRLYEQDGVVFATPLIERQRRRREDPDDPHYGSQWHLENSGQAGGVAGNDLNVSPVWNFTAGTGLGTGVNIAVVDDGLETVHADLAENVRSNLDIDLNGGDNDPNPGAGNVNDIHGTSVAGVAAARGDNNLGTSGVAPRAGLVGVRLIAAPATDAQEAQAISHRANEVADADRVHVSNNSWGPSDDGATLDAPGPLLAAALESGVLNGRGALGVIYCWAGGNGGPDDVATYDGYANSRFVIAVGASRNDGTQASYSESGPNILINAPGGDNGSRGIVATDRTGVPGFSVSGGDFTAATDNLRGTSFATPAIAGVVALMLEANPALTWRDVRHGLVRTATRNDASDPGWFTNDGGYDFNVKHGFGRADAAAAVAAVAPATWVRAPAEATPLTAGESGSFPIPDNSSTGVSRTRTISGPADFRIEYVELTVSVSHSWRGDLRFTLTAPDGTVSDFLRRPFDDGASLSNWVFTSVAHWGEDPNGVWTLKVTDEAANDQGTLTAWSLKIHGYQPYSATPTITTVTPSRIARGSGDTTITIVGSSFAAGASRVRWNGVNLATTVDSPTQVRAVVPAGNLTVSGTATVTVATPGFDGEPALVSAGSIVTIDAAPTLTSVTPSPASTPEDTPVVITVTAADSDTAAGSLVFSATSSDQSVVTNGNLVFSGSGFSRPLTVTPVPDAVGASTLTVTVSDGTSSASTTVNFTTTAVDDPPVAFGGRFRVEPGVQLSETVTGFDPDGQAVTFSAVTDPVPAAVHTFNMQSNGNGNFTFTPGAGFRGMVAFTYKAIAGGQDSVPAQVFITVAGNPNGTRPVISSNPPEEQIEVGDAFSYTVQADTSRYVVAPTLAYSLVGAPTTPTAMTINSTTGAIAWTAGGADRHLSFGIVVKDTVTGALDTQTVVLRVVAVGASN